MPTLATSSSEGAEDTHPEMGVGMAFYASGCVGARLFCPLGTHLGYAASLIGIFDSGPLIDLAACI